MKKILTALCILVVIVFVCTACESKKNNETENTNTNDNTNTNANTNDILPEETETKDYTNSKEFNNDTSVSKLFGSLSEVAGLNSETIMKNTEINEKYDFSNLKDIDYQVRSKLFPNGYAEVAIIKLKSAEQNVEAFNLAAKRKQKLQEENWGFDDALYQVEQKDGILFIAYAPNSAEILKAFEDYMNK